MSANQICKYIKDDYKLQVEFILERKSGFILENLYMSLIVLIDF